MFDENTNIIGRQRTSKKYAGRPPRFSFAVPIEAAGTVAFHLAKAGMTDFEVEHFEEDEFSMFAFPTEPEMRIAEEIIRAEYATQIRSHKDLWSMWSETEDLTQVKGERELRQQQKYVASVEQDAAWATRIQGKFAGQWGDRSYDSDQVHDLLDAYRRKSGDPGGEASKGFDEPVPQELVAELLSALDAGNTDEQDYLGVVVFLVTHGSNVPQVYRERARQIAFAFVQDESYLGEWQNPNLRKVELENEIELLEGPNKMAAMTDAEVKRMDVYRRKKLLAWIEELGLDLDDELRRYDAGDFWEKDAVYEEVRGMLREERAFQSAYRRKMRG